MDELEQEGSEAALKSAVSLHKATIESTADGILVVDLNEKIVSFNQKFIAMWRIPDTIVKSRDDARAVAFVLDQLVRPDDFLSKVRDLYAKPDGESFDTLEFKDGRIFDRYSIPQRVDGHPVGRVWSFRDVTEHRRTEAALRASRAELEQRVETRTRELSEANEALHTQLSERKRVEEALFQALGRLRQLSRHVLELQENEYRVVSRELHDNIGQAVTAVKMRLERFALGPDKPNSRDQEEMRLAVSLLQKIASDTRRLSKQLRPEILDELGLCAALDSYMKEFQQLSGIQTDFQCIDVAPLPRQGEAHLYRLVQEALANVAKHARANYVSARLEVIDQDLVVSIIDNGVGFAWSDLQAGRARWQGVGMTSMHERADILGGGLVVESSPGKGTRIVARIPLSPRAD